MYLKRLIVVVAAFMVTLMSLEGSGLPIEAQGVPPPIIVNAADDADDGACTDVHCNLREAIEQSNASPGIKDTILFDLPALATIQPTIALPPITDPVIIDGRLDPGSTSGPTPGIVLDGTFTQPFIEFVEGGGLFKSFRTVFPMA